MPFLDEITGFINDTLKGGSLNKEKIQPVKFNGIAGTYFKKGAQLGSVEGFPAIINGKKIEPIAPNSKLALQVYHKLLTKAYGYEKKSYGNDYIIKCVCDLQMVAITNYKLTGKAKEALEPAFIFGLPQRLSPALIAGLGIEKCLITPVSSNMDELSVFRQEFPKADFFLNETVSMFSIRYRVEESFSQQCVDACLC